MSADERVLEVADLRVHYGTDRGDVIAVNGTSLSVSQGETLGLVGESGSGKSTVAMAILRLVQPPGRIVGGQVLINGRNVISMPESEMQRLRWREASLIPQGSMNSLNPVMRVKDQIADAIRAHSDRVPRRDLRRRIVELLSMVDLPERVYDMYPHELSGGMKQRVCIASAIALSPALIIADEPTSALDVVVQKLVAETLREVKERLGSSMILIGHDMALQAQLVDRVAVMFAGNIVETAPVTEIFADPRHPYTRHLISSVPSIKKRTPLEVKRMNTPDLRRRRPVPRLVEVSPGHFAAESESQIERADEAAEGATTTDGVSR